MIEKPGCDGRGGFDFFFRSGFIFIMMAMLTESFSNRHEFVNYFRLIAHDFVTLILILQLFVTWLKMESFLP